MLEIQETDDFKNNYPDQPARLHVDGNSALMTRASLASLSGKLAPHLVEYNSGDLPKSIDPKDVKPADKSAVEIIERLGEANSWMTLRNVENDPDYAALTDSALAPLQGTISGQTGDLLRRESFVFISSPAAVTPFHIDEEHNILMQIEGSKTVTVYSQHDRELNPQTNLETFHAGGHRNIALDPSFEDRGQKFHLTPGDALYIPPLAPHWVKVDDDAPSLSLSTTWRSHPSMRVLYLHQINHELRSRGFNPPFPGEAPTRDQIKIWGASAIRRFRKAFGGRPNLPAQ